MSELTEHYGKGWSYYKPKHCVRSAYLFQETQLYTHAYTIDIITVQTMCAK